MILGVIGEQSWLRYVESNCIDYHWGSARGPQINPHIHTVCVSSSHSPPELCLTTGCRSCSKRDGCYHGTQFTAIVFLVAEKSFAQFWFYIKSEVLILFCQVTCYKPNLRLKHLPHNYLFQLHLSTTTTWVQHERMRGWTPKWAIELLCQTLCPLASVGLLGAKLYEIGVDGVL